MNGAEESTEHRVLPFSLLAKEIVKLASSQELAKNSWPVGAVPLISTGSTFRPGMYDWTLHSTFNSNSNALASHDDNAGSVDIANIA